MRKFDLGQLVMTRWIENLIIKEDVDNSQEIAQCVIKHSQGDWGNLCEEDKQLNDMAVVDGGRILSAYEIGENKVKIWIITKADRSCTTILLPEEYWVFNKFFKFFKRKCWLSLFFIVKVLTKYLLFDIIAENKQGDGVLCLKKMVL